MNISGLRRMALVFAVGAVLLGLPASAEAQAPWSFQTRVGLGVPGGNPADVANVGPSFGAGIARWLSNRVAIRADLDIDLLDGEDQVDDVTLYHYSAGVEMDLLEPQVTRWKLHGDVGLGATTFDSGARSFLQQRVHAERGPESGLRAELPGQDLRRRTPLPDVHG